MGESGSEKENQTKLSQIIDWHAYYGLITEFDSVAMKWNKWCLCYTHEWIQPPKPKAFAFQLAPCVHPVCFVLFCKNWGRWFHDYCCNCFDHFLSVWNCIPTFVLTFRWCGALRMQRSVFNLWELINSFKWKADYLHVFITNIFY